MSEHLQETNHELNRLSAINQLVEEVFPDDIHFMLEQLQDEEDVVAFLYGQLLGRGEDPDEVLQRYGITEKSYEV